MFLTLADLGQTASIQPTSTGVRGLDAIDASIFAAVSITGPLASSPSQNEARRRDLLTALTQTSIAAAAFAPVIVALGWDLEPKAILSVKDGADKLADLVREGPSTKTSWADLDAGVRSLYEKLSAARVSILARAVAEALAAASHAKARIAGLAVKQPMTDEDWANVDAVAGLVQRGVALIGRLPLGRDDAARYTTIGVQLWTALDTKLESVSSGFMNAVEGVARSTGAAPQQGRRGAAWVERNKWPILGASALLVGALVLSSKN